jgi:hypothetical protein
MARGAPISNELLARLRRMPGDAEVEPGQNAAPLGSTTSGVVVLRKTFQYQSYFSTTLMERAILTQSPSEPIVPSTKQIEETGGYGIAVYPSSESPVAVQLIGSGGSGGSPFIMRPGEVFRASTPFDAIRYGIPFGWLGGGLVQIRVLQGKDDNVSFFGEHEILFHRIRLPVWALAAAPALGIRGTSPNWPTKFPWPNAYDLNGTPQKGQPSLAITPTRTVVRVRANVAAGFRMRASFYQTDDLDMQADGASYDRIDTSASMLDLMWGGGAAASGFAIGALVGAEFPTMMMDQDASRLGGSNAIAAFLDMDGAVPPGTFLDIERFGMV